MNRLIKYLLGLLACGALAFATDTTGPGGPGTGLASVQSGDTFQKEWSCFSVTYNEGNVIATFGTPNGTFIAVGGCETLNGNGYQVRSSPNFHRNGKEMRVKHGRLQERVNRNLWRTLRETDGPD